MLLFTIQSRMRANNQRVYTPHEGRLVSDINRVWGPSSQHPRGLWGRVAAPVAPSGLGAALLPVSPGVLLPRLSWGSSGPSPGAI